MPEPLQLRDIHLPDPVGWWPPAPGWWIAGLTLLVLAVLLILFIRVLVRRSRPRRIALRKLQLIRQLRGHEAWQALNRLLKQIAMRGEPALAPCSGRTWIQALESAWPADTVSLLEPLAHAPYQPHAEASEEDFHRLCMAAEQWIRRQL